MTKRRKPRKDAPATGATPVSPANQRSYIEDTLKFVVDSAEVREHLVKWLAHESVKHPADICAEIVYHAPVPIEAKYPILEQLSKFDNMRDDGEDVCNLLWDVEDALKWRYEHEHSDNPESIEFRVFMYDQPKGSSPVNFATYDEAVSYIRSIRKNNDGDIVDTGNIEHEYHEFGKNDIIEKWVSDGDGVMVLWVSWLFNEDGEIHYFNRPCGSLYRDYSTELAGFTFTIPFQPGDIVTTDCTPFGKEQKVLILENRDRLDWVDGYSVTCLFINDRNNIDYGNFKLGDFLTCQKFNYVSPMYRAKTYTGELAESEAPLGIIATAIKGNPNLGEHVARRMAGYTSSILDFPSVDDAKERKSCGFGWKFLRKALGL